MSNNATNNKDRARPRMTDTELRREARKAGFQYKSHCFCEPCNEELERAMQSEGYTGIKPSWGNPICALKFYKKGTLRLACTCGWRKDISPKWKPVDKPACKVRGCRNLVGKQDTDNICQPCRKEIAGGGNPAIYSQFCTLKPTNGCMHYIHGGNEDCKHIKCERYDPIAAAMAPHIEPVKICKGKNGKKCANPLPPGRGAWCYTCHPKTSVAINM